MPNKNLYDKELFQRMAQGDEAAFRQTFDHYKRRFYTAAFKMTRSPDTAEEIVQDVFVNLWLHRRGLERVERPEAYLFSMVYNQIKKHFKKMAMERMLKHTVVSHLTESECLTEDILLEKENQEIFQDIVGKLPPQQRLVFRLSRLEGLSRDEIANRLNISPNTVKNHLLKALSNIRCHLNKLLFLVTCYFI